MKELKRNNVGTIGADAVPKTVGGTYQWRKPCTTPSELHVYVVTAWCKTVSTPIQTKIL